MGRLLDLLRGFPQTARNDALLQQVQPRILRRESTVTFRGVLGPA
jgi:hypothetical protein